MSRLYQVFMLDRTPSRNSHTMELKALSGIAALEEIEKSYPACDPISITWIAKKYTQTVEQVRQEAANTKEA